MYGDLFLQLGMGMLLASGGEKPGLMLNILNAQDSLTTKNCPNVNSAKIEKP